MKKTTISRAKIHKAVAASSALEGLSFEEARKNKAMIKLLRAHGRAFSIDDE